MKVSHGNLICNNIGITFDGRVKFMDFQCQPEEVNEENFRKDFDVFESFVSKVLERDSNYPYKFSSFNSEEHRKWEHIFSIWHITSPL
jgi:tRNA A-37 threonylcarbamoyl transferase component Bud32